MKIVILIIFLISGISCSASDQQSSSADSAYSAHNYQLAINIYSDLLTDDHKSAILYFNLGNAYFKNNELGKAIWAYQKAKKIAPAEKDIQFNLNHAENLVKGKRNKSKLSTKFFTVFFGHSINFWPILAFISLLIATILLFYYKLATTKNKKSALLILGTLSVFSFLFSISLAFKHYSYIHNQINGVITTSVVQVNSAPSKDETVVFELHEGANFNVIQKQGDWYRIEVDNNQGWIKNSNSLLY